MRVNQDRVDVFVPQQYLDGANTVARLQQVHCNVRNSTILALSKVSPAIISFTYASDIFNITQFHGRVSNISLTLQKMEVHYERISRSYAFFQLTTAEREKRIRCGIINSSWTIAITISGT